MKSRELRKYFARVERNLISAEAGIERYLRRKSDALARCNIFFSFFIKCDTCRTIITLAARKAGVRVGLANDYNIGARRLRRV